jgi:purine-binding chemotaxis protein CheW
MDIAKIRKKLKKKSSGKKKPSGKRGAKPGGDADEKASGVVSSVPGETSAPHDAGVVAEKSGTEKKKGEELETERHPAAGVDAGSQEVEEEGDFLELLIFSLNGEEYAFRVSDVVELLRPYRISIVPMTDPFVLGVISLRGRIIPVVDIQRRLTGSEGGDKMGKSKIIVLRGPKGIVGVINDMRMEFITLPERELVEPPGHLQEPASAYIESVVPLGERFISIVNTKELLDFNSTLEAQ